MNKEAQGKKRISVMLNPQDYIRLTQLAESSGRTRPGYLRWLFHLHLKSTEPPRAPTP